MHTALPSDLALTRTRLEITGYGLLDHFLGGLYVGANRRWILTAIESDTYLHAWEQIAIILQDTSIHGIICDIGLPIMHRNNRYNCRVLILDGKILFSKHHEIGFQQYLTCHSSPKYA